MEIIKVVNFLKKHKTRIFLPIVCIMQLLTCFYSEFWIISTIFSVTLLCFSDFAHIIYYTIFFQTFSSCGDFSVINTFSAISIILIRYIIGLIKKTEKFYVMPFVITCLICIIGSLRFTDSSKLGLYQGSALISALFFFYLLFVYRDRFSVQKCADFLISGILVTAGISLSTILFKTHISKFVDVFGNLHRLKLLTGNENSLAIYCALALSSFVSSIINGKGNIFKNIIFGLTAIGFGLSTKSKCFLIVCAFIILYLFFMLIMNYKKKSLMFIAPAILLMTIMYFAFRSTIGAIIDRLLVRVDGEFSLSAFTTDRSKLWTIYLNEITSSIPNMLFGVGLFGKRLARIGPHNLYIHILYRLGFVGVVLLGILGYFYYKDSDKKVKLNLKNSLILVVFLMIGMVESFL